MSDGWHSDEDSKVNSWNQKTNNDWNKSSINTQVYSRGGNRNRSRDFDDSSSNDTNWRSRDNDRGNFRGRGDGRGRGRGRGRGGFGGNRGGNQGGWGDEPLDSSWGDLEPSEERPKRSFRPRIEGETIEIEVPSTMVGKIIGNLIYI